MVNILYESIYMSFKRKSFLKKDIYAYIKIKKYILKHLDSENCMDGSIKQLNDIIRNNSSLWGNVLYKLPVMNFSFEQIKYIEHLDNTLSLNKPN